MAAPKNSIFKIVIIAITFGCLSTGSILAQKTPIKIFIGDQVEVFSENLNENRTLMIYYPPGYDMTSSTYPVIYMLDGIDHFVHGSGIVHYLSINGQIPPMIVVALVNTDRTRDLSPTHTTGENWMTTSGGADKFIDFLELELFPYIDTTYRTDPYRILMGHSLAGLFAVYSMATKPDLFNSYIVISPGLNWDNDFVINRAENYFKSKPADGKRLFMTFANEGGEMKDSMNKFLTVLEKHAPDNIEWEYSDRDHENHGTVVHKSIYDGLEYIYSGWPISAEVVQKNDLAALLGHYDRLSAKYGYIITVPENTLNLFGYRLVQASKFDEAISAFKLNARNYPQSANVFDSLGDGYDAAGKFDLAYESYKKAHARGLEIGDPNTDIYKQNYERMEKVLNIE